MTAINGIQFQTGMPLAQFMVKCHQHITEPKRIEAFVATRLKQPWRMFVGRRPM